MLRFLIFLNMFLVSLSSYSSLETRNDLNKVYSNPRFKNNYKICIIGDSGMASKGQELVAESLMEERCDQIRHTGDIIYPDGLTNSKDKNFKKKFYRYYKGLMKKNIPIYLSMGNHDYHNSPNAWIDLSKKYAEIKFPSLYYMDIYNDFCFLTLDTNANFDEQINWLNKIKVDYKNICKNYFAFGHHPMFSSGEHGNASLEIQNFLKATIEGDVAAYFTGHDHNLEDIGVINNTHHFISGAAGSAREFQTKPKVWGKAKLGYLVLEITYQSDQPKVNYSFFTVSKKSGKKKLAHAGKIQLNKENLASKEKN